MPEAKPPENSGCYHAGRTPLRVETRPALLRLGDGAAGTDEARRVLRGTAEAHLEMQVRAGGAAGVAGERDALGALHDVALLDEQPRQVGIARHEVVAVIDIDHVA